MPRDIPKEPEQTQERRAIVQEEWPLPAVVVAYHVVYDGHPDSYPLHLTSKILFDGESARMTRELVYDKRIARGRLRQREPPRGPEPVLRGRDRSGRAVAPGGRTRDARASSTT